MQQRVWRAVESSWPLYCKLCWCARAMTSQTWPEGSQRTENGTNLTESWQYYKSQFWHGSPRSYECLIINNSLCTWICMASLASWFDQNIIERYWTSTKTLPKTIVPILFIHLTQYANLACIIWTTDVIWSQNVLREMKDPKHPLHYLLTPVKVFHSQMVLRPTYQLPLRKATCYGRDFVPYCISKKF